MTTTPSIGRASGLAWAANASDVTRINLPTIMTFIILTPTTRITCVGALATIIT